MLPLAELTIDPATITVAIGTAISWLLVISNKLGRYQERQGKTEGETKDLKETIKGIFTRLDELAKAVPHQCDKGDRLMRLEMLAIERSRRLESLEHWRNEVGFHAAHVAEQDHDTIEEGLGRKA